MGGEATHLEDALDHGVQRLVDEAQGRDVEEEELEVSGGAGVGVGAAQHDVLVLVQLAIFRCQTLQHLNQQTHQSGWSLSPFLQLS